MAKRSGGASRAARRGNARRRAAPGAAKRRRSPAAGPGRLAIVLAIAEDAVITADAAQRIAFFNRGAEKAFGYAAAEVIGRPLETLMPARFAEAHRDHVADFARSPEPARMMAERAPVWGLRKDGSEFRAEASIAKWGAGRNAGFAVFLRDISERLSLQGALVRTNRLLAAQLEASLDAMLVVDENGLMASFNRRFVELWDIPSEVVAARSDRLALQSVLHKLADPEEFLARVAYLYEHKQERSAEEIRLRDGRVLDRYSAPMFGGEGTYLGRVWYFRDISERKHAEQALRRTMDDLREAQRVGQMGSWRLDLASNEVVWSEEIYRMLGLDPSRPATSYPEQERLFTPESWERLTEALARTRERGVPYELELQTVRPDGTSGWMLAIGEAIRDGGGRITGIRGTAQDITERKRSTIALRRANRALRVLSATNQALIHAESEPALLERVCRIIVELGGYRMAWIGLVERDAAQSVRPVAQTGYEAGYLESAAITWADTERGRGPTGTAARTGATQVSRHIASDPHMAPWRADALARGYASSIALPLGEKAAPFGVLTIYAPEPDAFDGEETLLLEELSEDLAFGIAGHRSNAEHRQAEARAERLANFDVLTGLANRVRLAVLLEDALQAAQARAEPLALMTLGVDRFSEVQDAFGLEGADALLRDFAARLEAVAGDAALVARVGLETFPVVLPRCDAGRAREEARRIHAMMSHPFEHAGIPVDLPAAIGIAVYPEHGTTAASLILRSDIAVRQAREAGAAIAVYSGKAEAESPARLQLLAELRKAIGAGELVLHYQPKIAARAARVSGAEALVRWRHPKRGLVPPGEFIPLAEHTGLIGPLTYWVLDAALEQLAAWGDAGLAIPVAVNVSPSNLLDPEFVDRIAALQRKWGARLDLLELEITESALMADPARSHALLVRLRELGVRVHIDDFGTGYSSLSHIATLPIQAIKIDRAFVERVAQQAEHRAIVEAAISVARALRMRVVAEGIETQEQADILLQMGCDELQGYLFSRPLPAAEFLRWRAGFEGEPSGAGR